MGDPRSELPRRNLKRRPRLPRPRRVEREARPRPGRAVRLRRRSGPAQQPAGQQPRLQPAGPAERDPGRGQPEQPADRGGGGERLRQRRLADLPDDRRRPLWTTQFRSSVTKETGDFCGGGGDPALTYSKRDHAFYFAQLCFFRTFLPIRGRGDPLDRQRQDLEPVAARRVSGLQLLAEPRRLQPGAVLRQGADHRRQQPVEPPLRAALRHLHQVPHQARTASATTARCRSPTPTTSTRTATAISATRSGIGPRSSPTTRAARGPARRPTRGRSRWSTTTGASTSRT